MRPLLAFLFASMVLGGIACSGAAPTRTTTESANVLEPTPNIQATVRAAVEATISAAPKPATVAQQPPPTSMPAPAISAKPIASPTTVANIKLEAVDFNSYTNQAGYTYIHGFIQNSGTSAAANVQVAVSLIGDGNTTIGAGNAHIKPDMLKPGSRAPWLTQVQGTPNFKEIRVQVQAEPLGGFGSASLTQDFRLDGVSVRPPANQFSSPTISGQVFNEGSKRANLVEVTAAIYDTEGKLFQVVNAFTKLQEIAPGQSAPFEITPIGRDLKAIHKYELYVEGRAKD